MLIHSSLYIADTSSMGRGVYTSEDLEKSMLVEESPVIVMSREERKKLDETLLHDYIFEWGEKKAGCCMAMGYVPIYNHSYRSNCEYEMDFDKKTIRIHTVRFIKAGEELLINYNGDWNDGKALWFDAK
jgi:SET domain-containing protein